MEIVLSKFPKTLEAFKSMPELDFTSPFHVTVLFIAAICIYPENKNECFRMIDVLRGPQKLTAMEKQYIHNRMMGKSEYIGRSYLVGSTPENDYLPTPPFRVIVEGKCDTYIESGYAKLYVKSGGAAHSRPITLRKKGDDWFLWEYGELLADIYKPTSTDPWL